jgi:hypothetical protein
VPQQTRKPPQYLIRLLMPVVFVVGGVLLILWAQGFRITLDGGGIVSTGVIAVSTNPPESNVFINDTYRGETPDVFLGIPLGKNNFCVFQNQFRSFCHSVIVDSYSVTHVNNVQLLPSRLQYETLGPAQEYLFDPLGRGYLRHYKNLAYVQIVTDAPRSIEAITTETEVFLNQTGQVILVSPTGVQTRDVFAESQAPFTPALPKSGNIIYASNNNLLLQKPLGNITQDLYSFPEEIESIIPLPNSDSYVVVLQSEIWFLPMPTATPQPLFLKDALSPVRFYAARSELVFVINNELARFRFPQ